MVDIHGHNFHLRLNDAIVSWKATQKLAHDDIRVGFWGVDSNDSCDTFGWHLSRALRHTRFRLRRSWPSSQGDAAALCALANLRYQGQHAPRRAAAAAAPRAASAAGSTLTLGGKASHAPRTSLYISLVILYSDYTGARESDLTARGLVRSTSCCSARARARSSAGST